MQIFKHPLCSGPNKRETQEQLSQAYQVSSCRCTRLHRSQSEAKSVKPCPDFLMDTWTQKKLNALWAWRTDLSSVQFLGFVHFVGFCVQFWILWPRNFSSEGGGEMSTCIWCYSLMWLWTLKISLKKGQRRLSGVLPEFSLPAHQIRFTAAVKVVEQKQWIVHVQKCKFMMDVCYKF